MKLTDVCALKLLKIHIFGKSLVLMSFYDLRYFWIFALKLNKLLHFYLIEQMACNSKIIAFSGCCQKTFFFIYLFIDIKYNTFTITFQYYPQYPQTGITIQTIYDIDKCKHTCKQM